MKWSCYNNKNGTAAQLWNLFELNLLIYFSVADNLPLRGLTLSSEAAFYNTSHPAVPPFSLNSNFSVHPAQITIYSLFVFCYNKTQEQQVPDF